MVLMLFVAGVAQSTSFQDQSYQEGQRYYRTADYRNAYKVLKPLADAGHTFSQLYIANQYEKGLGISKNIPLAFKYYQLAAQSGNDIAELNVAYYYKRGLGGVTANSNEAIRWYNKSAEKNNSIAQYNLAYLYETEAEPVQDYSKAIYWYTQAAQNGSPEAQHRLFKVYQEGLLGLKLNHEKAKEYRTLFLTNPLSDKDTVELIQKEDSIQSLAKEPVISFPEENNFKLMSSRDDGICKFALVKKNIYKLSSPPRVVKIRISAPALHNKLGSDQSSIVELCIKDADGITSSKNLQRGQNIIISTDLPIEIYSKNLSSLKITGINNSLSANHLNNATTIRIERINKKNKS